MSGPILIGSRPQPSSGPGRPYPPLTPGPAARSAQVDHPVFVGEGLVARFAKVKHVTPRGVLDSPVWLPVVLAPLTITETSNHSDYQTLSAGQFSQAPMGSKPRQLRTADIDSLTLTYDVPWMVATRQDPDRVREAITQVLRSHKPVELLLTLRPGAEVEERMNITMRQLTTEIRGGERDTRYVTVAIEEWRDPQVGRRSSQASRKRGVQLPTTHVLKAGDTLHSLSHEYYGTYQHWRAIRDANGISKRFGPSTPLVSAGAAARPGPGGAVGFRAGHKLKVPKVAR